MRGMSKRIYTILPLVRNDLSEVISNDRPTLRKLLWCSFNINYRSSVLVNVIIIDFISFVLLDQMETTLCCANESPDIQIR